MIIHEDIAQLSPEWWAIRQKKLTGSHAQAIATQGTGLTTYVLEIMAEYYSNTPKEHFSNHHTERGMDLEDSAAAIFVFEHNVDVRKVGFVEMNSFVGVSPDLFIAEDEVGEIKCLASKGHLNALLGKIDSKFLWQCQMELLVCKKKVCNLIFYNPTFEIKNSLVVHRIHPDAEKFKKLQAGFIKGKQMIEEIERKMETKK